MKFAFVLYPGIEPIDLAALGVISMARRVVPALSFVTVAADERPSEFSSGLKVVPDATFDSFDHADVLITPGGPGWKAAARDARLLAFLRSARVGTHVTLCTGAMIAAAAGVLDGRMATTKVEAIGAEEPPLDILGREYPRVEARKALLVDTGDVITGGGVSLCIDTMLHFIATRIGQAQAGEAARILEYGAAWEANRQRLPVLA